VHDDTTEREQLPPSEEVRRIAASFEERRSRYDQWELAGSSSARWGTARVCRVNPGRVLHVIGASEMAETLRELLGHGDVVGWSLQPMAESRTPLYEYLDRFQNNTDDPSADARGYKQLDVAGFVYGEEVAACPDDVLRAIRNIGPRALATIRQIIGGPPPATPPAERRVGPVPPVPAARDHVGRAVLLEETLTPATRARYPELVAGLVASRMPDAAVDKIVAALNAEPVPPADPLVALLLETAGELGMLELYRATHDSAQT
jgi:hypothetical protein